MNLTTRLLATTAILCATTTYAQDAFDLGEITVSGSLSPVGTDESGATVDVLTAQDIDGDSTDLIGSLTALPGVYAASNGGIGGTNLIQIRGLPARYTAVRINGIDVSDPSGVQLQYNFGGLTSTGLERVEVLRGSQSALYGSEAIAGLVDIQTFRPTELGFSGKTSIEYGSFNTVSGGLSIGQLTETSEFALTYGRVLSDGFSSQANNDEKDGFEQDTWTLFASFDVTDDVTLGLSVYDRRGVSQFDGFGAVDAELTFAETGAQVFSEIDAGYGTHRISYTMFDVDRSDPTGFTSRFDGTRDTIAYEGSFNLAGGRTLNIGLDRTEETFTTEGFGVTTGGVDTTSAQAELLFSPMQDVNVSAALRYDDDSDFGGQLTGRVSAIWTPQEDLALRAVIGTGFRAPSLFERFSSFGNPDLIPEESTSYELGIEKSYGDLASVRATLFRTDIDNLIGFDAGSYNQVPGLTRAQGLELSGDYALSGDTTLYGAYTYTSSKDQNGRSVRVPRHNLLVGFDTAFTDTLTGSLEVRHVADVLPSAFAPADNKVGDYTLVNVAASYDLGDGAEAYARIENLLDEDYEISGGFNTAGRSVYLGVRAEF